MSLEFGFTFRFSRKYAVEEVEIWYTTNGMEVQLSSQVPAFYATLVSVRSQAASTVQKLSKTVRVRTKLTEERCHTQVPLHQRVYWADIAYLHLQPLSVLAHSVSEA